MKRYILFSAVVLGILVSAELTAKEQLINPMVRVKRVKAAGDIKAVVGGNSKFAFELYGKLAGDKKVKETGGNLFFSPYSISTALGMTWAGARGQTEKQMAKTMHFTLAQERQHNAFGKLEKQLNKGGKEGGYQLSVANALWGQEGYDFLAEFLELTRKSYGAGLREVDFAKETEKARKKINSWVEKKTKDKIKDLIKPGILDALTRLVLTNAIYFKGDWETQFDKKNTKDSDFNISADKKTQIEMMYMKGDFKYWGDEDLQVIELPYKGGHLSMVVVLPKEAGGLAAVEKELTVEKLNGWLKDLRKREVSVYFPKFKMTSQFELSEYLKILGMPDAFSGAADFSGMTGGRDLFISNVIHKAFVAVDEKGTEAAAATAVTMKLTSVGPPPVVFRADRPFVFLIRDNRSGSLLFMGRVVNPAKEGK